MFKHLIYGLTDPRDGQVRYVGQSSKGLVRPRQHAFPSNLKKVCRRSSWIKSLQKLGLTYGIVVLFSVPTADALGAAERYWIADFRARGCRLTNHTDGGEGALGLSPSPEARAKMSAAKKGRPGRRYTQAARAVARDAAKGRKRKGALSEAHRCAIAESQRGHLVSQETRRRISDAKCGYRHSEEAKQKMRDAALNRARKT